MPIAFRDSIDMIYVVGDTHGCYAVPERPPEVNEMFVYLGDYLDSYVFDAATQVYNFRALLAFKRKYKRNVVLLLGNHDAGYLYPSVGRYCTGFNKEVADALKPDVARLRSLFQVALYTPPAAGGNNPILFTHAGITGGYLKILNDQAAPPFLGAQLESALNSKVKSSGGRHLLFKVGRRRGGSGPGGPLWADASEHKEDPDPLPRLDQVVGHTTHPHITEFRRRRGIIYFCDTLDPHSKQMPSERLKLHYL